MRISGLEMHTEKQPICYLIAVPNGAGKATFALCFQEKGQECKV